jgi:hypothetical protein
MRFGHDSFSKKPLQETEERIPGNQLALFGLRLRRLPERLLCHSFELWVSSFEFFPTANQIIR